MRVVRSLQVFLHLGEKTIPVLAAALGVSQPYAAAIRSGRRFPHPKHWLFPLEHRWQPDLLRDSPGAGSSGEACSGASARLSRA